MVAYFSQSDSKYCVLVMQEFLSTDKNEIWVLVSIAMC